MEGRIDLAYNQNFIKIIILWFSEHKVNDGFSGPMNDGISDTYSILGNGNDGFQIPYVCVL